MPTVRKYNEGAVIYFDKDVGEDVYLLKSGSVSIKFISEDTNEEITKIVRIGEIFGLKSAIASLPRGETAIATEPSEVIVFTTKEFENFVSNKSEIIFKTLRALTNQLRNIGIRVNNILSNNTIIPPDLGMFKIGEYFLQSRKYSQAIQVFQRFIKSYPDSQLVKEAKKRIEISEKALKTGVLDKFTPVTDSYPQDISEMSSNFDIDSISFDGTVSSIMKAIFLAENMYNQGKIDECLKIIDKLFNSNIQNNIELFEKVYLIKAKALSKVKRYDEAIETYKMMIEKFPNSRQLKIAMFGIATSLLEKGDKNSAVMMLKKIASTPPYDEISEKAKELANKFSQSV